MILNILRDILTNPLLPPSVMENVYSTLGLIFHNFTLINIVCHLNYVKLILSLILGIWLFRKILNLIRFIFSKAHTTK